MRKILVGLVLASAMAGVGPPLMAQQLDRLTVERLVPRAEVALQDQGTMLRAPYIVQHDTAAPTMTIGDKSAGKKKNDRENASSKGDQRAQAAGYHLRL